MSTETPALVPVEELVARSAAFLDEVTPGWTEQIDLDDFDMVNGHSCVIGQVYGSWDERYKVAILLDPENADLIRGRYSDDWEANDRAYYHVRQVMIDHGFLVPLLNGEVDFERYDQLTAAWEVEIRRRRQDVTS